MNTSLKRVGYVVKRYPRYSETFIVNEIIAHEESGLDIEIFSLRPTVDTHFQDTLSRVRASVTYLPYAGLRAADFWAALEGAAKLMPDIWQKLSECEGEEHHDIYQALLLAEDLVKKGVTHLHAHFASSATTVARLAALFAGVPYSFTAHAKDIFHESVDPADLKRKFNDASQVVTISDFNLEFLKKRYRSAHKKCVRIYNGLDLERFSFEEKTAESSMRIVAVGRLVEKKGFKYLVQACKILLGRGVDFRCKIIGEGELETELKQLIAEYGLKKYVELSGPRPQQEIVEELRRSTVFVAPCVVGSDGNQDGLPTVILESMALGTPCISTDVTGIPEIVKNGETGLLVAQRDPIALSKAIELLFRDRGLVNELSKTGRRLMEKAFNVKLNSEKMRKLFSIKATKPVKRAKKEVV